MERSSQYDFVVLQATNNSIPFYESMGFVRVGAVARYNLAPADNEDTPAAPVETDYNFNKT